MKTKILMVLAGLAFAGGITFLAVCFGFLHAYYSGPVAPVRGENLTGAMISIIYSLPFWFTAFATTYLIEDKIPKRIYKILNSIIVIGAFGGFFAFLIVAMK